jgi:hypothetical protein
MIVRVKAGSKNNWVVNSKVSVPEDENVRIITWMCTVRPKYQPGKMVLKVTIPLPSVV